MARQKNTKTPLQDLYTEATTELMYLRRAFRLLKEHHPDFRNLGMPENRSEESLGEFVSQVKRIADEARRKAGGSNVGLEGISPMYLGVLDDLPMMFNPVTSELSDLFNNDED